MNGTEIVDRLAEHKILGAAPREELEWLVSHGSLRKMNPGDVLTAKGASVAGLFVVLSGRIDISVDRGAGPRKIMEWREGDVTGLLPYSRIVGPPGDTVAQEPTEILAVPRECLRELIRECHEVTAILVHSMIDRARLFNASALQDEKMVSLGKLSAGLAHELNNPASAILRSAELLGGRLEDAEHSARALGAARLTEAQLEAIDGVRESCASTSEQRVLSPMEQAEREETIADWLAEHGLDPALAEALTDTPTSIEGLNRLTAAVDGPALELALRWSAAGCTVRTLASEIQNAATQITSLVTAIKGFTHMDQAMVAEPVDLIQALKNTIAILKAKARAKSIAVSSQVESDFPRVRGFAAELNQIMANLIDNALDAAPISGRVDLLVNRDGRRAVLCVVDNGSGIPQPNLDKIFDPFFTTKPVGQGTGLGLDIVRRLVRHNDGEISVVSEPGRTEFRVVLPLAEIESTAGQS